MLLYLKYINYVYYSEYANDFLYIYVYLYLQAGGPSNLLMDLAANEKAVHADFFNGMYLI